MVATLATSANAGPVASGLVQGKADVVQARYGRNGALVGGLALGAIAGAAIASGGRHCDPAWEDCYPRRRYYQERSVRVCNRYGECWYERRY